jgi:hypothetical protein
MIDPHVPVIKNARMDILIKIKMGCLVNLLKINKISLIMTLF